MQLLQSHFFIQLPIVLPIGLLLDCYWTAIGLPLDCHWPGQNQASDASHRRANLLLDSYWIRSIFAEGTKGRAKGAEEHTKDRQVTHVDR